MMVGVRHHHQAAGADRVIHAIGDLVERARLALVGAAGRTRVRGRALLGQRSRAEQDGDCAQNHDGQKQERSLSCHGAALYSIQCTGCVLEDSMNRLIAFTLLALGIVSGSVGLRANGTPTRLLRTPSISATHVAFAYANNIWIVERKGGDARRLSSFQGQSTNPKISPDGDDGRVQRGLRRQHRCLRRAGERRRADAADVASRRRHRAGLDARRHEDHVRVGAADVGAEARRRDSGPCRRKAASPSRCRCRAATRERFLPTAGASPIA